MNGIQEVMGSNPTISMVNVLKDLIISGFQHIFCVMALLYY